MRWHKVSVEGARRDYGVVLTGADDDLGVDEAATAGYGRDLAAEPLAGAPFFDRGPGYARLSGGRAFAEVDFR